MKVHVAVLWPPKTTAPIAVSYDDDPEATAVLFDVKAFRTGRKLGRTVYAMASVVPSDEDVLVGVMETPYMASVVVDLLNLRLETLAAP